jgi:hypothetical protein
MVHFFAKVEKLAIFVATTLDFSVNQHDARTLNQNLRLLLPSAIRPKSIH